MGVKKVLNKAYSREFNLYNLFDTYLDIKESKNQSPSTIINAKKSLTKWLNYLEDNEYSLNPKDITPKYVYAFSRHYLSEEMRATTLNHYLRDIRAFVYWLAEEGHCEKFKIELVKEQEYIKDTYSKEELELLLARPSRASLYGEWRTWAMINYLYATGNRASTVCNLKLNDLNFTKLEIFINKTKTNKAYIIPMSVSLRNVLLDFVEAFRKNDINNPNAYLFANIGNEKLTTDALHTAIKRYNVSRGVNKTSVHAFRHTFAKDWIRGGGDVFRLQKMLGHTTLDMTRKYVNMFSEDLKEGFSEFNPLDRMKKSSSRTKRV